MTKKLSETEAKKVLGVSGSNTRQGTLRGDEFLPQLKGNKAIKSYREMRDNDATIGSVLYAAEQVLRDVKIKVEPSDKNDKQAVKEAKFVEEVLEDMDHTLDDHISEALSFLTFGFSWFDVVYKRRVGPYEKSKKKKSKFTDGRIGVRKISSRAPWTVSRFDVDQVSGDIKGLYQNVSLTSKTSYLPINKSLYYRTTIINGDPSGRSILRNAYTAYQRLQSFQNIEAVGIERDLAGIPVGRMPSEYFGDDATDSQKAVRSHFETVLRDLKNNEQGYALLPSDTFLDENGSPSNVRMMDINLMSSDGNRSFDVDKTIRRYQHDIARSVLSEFIMLGASNTGSYALSKSKTDLFLRCLESYIQTIVDVLNKQLVERLWELNGLDFKYLPKLKAGDIAPHDLKELGAYLRNLNGAGIPIRDQFDIVEELFAIPELPLPDKEVYEESLKELQENEKPVANVAGASKDQNKGVEEDDEKTSDRE